MVRVGINIQYGKFKLLLQGGVTDKICCIREVTLIEIECMGVI